MTVLEYGRSFVAFVVPGNNARLQVEARCVLTAPDGASEQFVLFASCKAEDTYGTLGALFKLPNYDFSGMFGETRYSLNRIHLTSDLEQLETGATADRFVSTWTPHLVEKRGRPLVSAAEVVAATFANEVIVGQTTIVDPGSGWQQMVEFPVKTMNVNPETTAFQVDTGPVPLYDFGAGAAEVMARFRWAFVAWRAFTGAEFICQAPTSILREGREVARTTHYSAVVVHPAATNALFALED